MTRPPSSVVIGAGLAGLTAAHRLRQAGVDVTVLERSPRPGGRVQTERHGAYLVDTGPDALTASYARYLNLVRELGLGDRIVSPSGADPAGRGPVWRRVDGIGGVLRRMGGSPPDRRGPDEPPADRSGPDPFTRGNDLDGGT